MKKAILFLVFSLILYSCEKESDCRYQVTHFTHEKGSDIYNVLEVTEEKKAPSDYQDGTTKHIFYSEQICY